MQSPRGREPTKATQNCSDSQRRCCCLVQDSSEPDWLYGTLDCPACLHGRRTPCRHSKDFPTPCAAGSEGLCRWQGADVLPELEVPMHNMLGQGLGYPGFFYDGLFVHGARHTGGEAAAELS